ncbi:MAG TPA: Uma2 family endonuclease, partial [Thermoanaerobaculia bacterium]|nr:Uma2 family endonuclease [Thermoanaerobaculia bacterium]
STERFDRQLKLPRYAKAGVSHLWLVHPADRRLEVFASVDLQWVLLEKHSGNATVFAQPFEATAIELAPLWS